MLAGEPDWLHPASQSRRGVKAGSTAGPRASQWPWMAWRCPGPEILSLRFSGGQAAAPWTLEVGGVAEPGEGLVEGGFVAEHAPRRRLGVDNRLYCFRTRRRGCDLRFGWMSWCAPVGFQNGE
jgi:hypothetical protein